MISCKRNQQNISAVKVKKKKNQKLYEQKNNNFQI